MAVKLAEVKDVPEGGSLIVRLSDGKEIALFKREDKIYALDNMCPHMGGPLGEGCIEGFRVACPWHGWEFDIRDGTCENMPGDNAQSIKLRIEGDGVFLDNEP